jgi:hypothetical protein
MTDARQNVLICVLCLSERQGWVNPWLSQSLCAMACDPRFNVTIEHAINHRPYHYARNRAVALARERGVDWLVEIDNDQSFVGVTPLDVLHAAGSWRKVIGVRSFGVESVPRKLYAMNSKPLGTEGDFTEVEHLGGSVLCIHSEIWQKIPGPWFLHEFGDDELGTTKNSEDWYFCDLVRRHKYQVWLHRTYVSHWHTLDLTNTALEMARRS